MTIRHRTIGFVSFLSLVMPLLPTVWADAAETSSRPNILWLFAEDTSPWMGCYGHAVNAGQTPHIDSLAERGVRFARAYVPAPVCSPCRSAMMGGMNQIRFNAHEHRSSRGPVQIQLPQGLKLLPELMKESGYFTFNLGKTDYNFVWDEDATYSLQSNNRNDIPWDTLQQQQPFFGQIQTAGGKNNTTKFPETRKTDPDSVTVPPEYPDNQLYHEVVAQHCDAIRKDDDFIGTVLQGLQKAGLSDNTIVVYFGDHGANNLVRHKQMPTEGGLHVPFIIAGPRQAGAENPIPTGQVRNDLVNLLDLSATTLAWGGVAIPDWYEGQDLFAADFQPRSWVAAAKDRLDHTIDRVRTVRTDRFRYTRNFKTDRVLLQPQYRDSRDFLVNLRELYASGELDPQLTKIYFGERPAEELHDVQNDPGQLNNLADDPQYAEELERHRSLLEDWIAAGDYGAKEEPREELAYQASGHKWGEGVNPEYETVREDNDGDGLSDDWERINGRDPGDGRLLFTFDCGGWQTEGWSSSDIQDNLAGYQGFLEFSLSESTGTLTRSGLQLKTSQNAGPLTVTLRATKPVEVTLQAGAQAADLQTVGARRTKTTDGTFSELAFDLEDSAAWSGTIQTLQLTIRGQPGTLIEIDSIAIP